MKKHSLSWELGKLLSQFVAFLLGAGFWTVVVYQTWIWATPDLHLQGLSWRGAFIIGAFIELFHSSITYGTANVIKTREKAESASSAPYL